MGYNWFRRMLLAYTPVFFVVVSFLVFAFYQTMSEQSRREALKSNQSLAGQALRYTEQTLRDIDRRILRESMVNENLQVFLNERDSSNIYVNVETIRVLQDLKINFPVIDSIYLVRASDEFVLSLRTSGSLDNYNDKKFIDNYIESGRSASWSDTRLFSEFASQAAKNVVTLARPMPFYYGSKGIIVVNVDTAKLAQAVKEMYDPEVSFIRLLDNSGASLLQSGGEQSEVLSRYTSGYTGWTIESGLLLSGVSLLLQSVNRIWIALGIVSIAGGVLWIVLVTRRAYKPLEQLVSQIQVYASKQELEDSHRPYKNEFSFIGQTFEHMIEQSDLHLQERKKYLAVQKKYVFEKLLKGTGALPVWEQEMLRTGMPAAFRPALVLLLEIDGYSEVVREVEQEEAVAIKASLEAAVQEMTSREGCQLWCGWLQDRQLGGILHVPEGMLASSQAYFVFFDRWREEIAGRFALTVTIALSEPVAIPEELRRAFREAEDALQYKASTGANRVIRYGETIGSESEVYGHLKNIRQIVGAFRLADASWQTHYRGLFEQIRMTMLRKDELTSLVYFLIYQLDKETEMLPQDIRKWWQEHTLPLMHEALADYDTIDTIEQEFLVLLGSLSEQMSAVRDSRNYHSLMLEVRAYIEAHYANPNLSLDHLSDLFELNGKYLSKLFKEEFGEKFVDFLIGLRMAAAKSALENSDWPIVEISERVGYTSANSFTRVFRKVYGISPGEYRKEERKKA